MPIVDDEQIAALLAAGQISAITMDTNIFEQKRLQLNSTTMKALGALKDRPFAFMLPSTVAKEVTAHLDKSVLEALLAAKKAIGQALSAFETLSPERDELLEMISGGKNAAETSRERWEAYVNETGCELLADTDLVDISTVFDGYFASEPPFDSGRKKHEFPDALALHALERTASDRGIGIMVVSQDGDWRSFCDRSARLFLVPEIERALALVTDAPVGLRTAISVWLSEGEGNDEARQNIAADVEQLEFAANAHPTNGQIEVSTWAGELQTIEWPDETEIDIIEVDDVDEDGTLRVVVSVSLALVVRVFIEMIFSFWDSVDKESVELGGRSTEVDEELDVRATIVLHVSTTGGKVEEISLEEVNIEDRYHVLELGEVDILEPDDYDALNEGNDGA